MDRDKLLGLLSDLTAPPRGRDNYQGQREALADYLLSLERRLEVLGCPSKPAALPPDPNEPYPLPGRMEY